MYVYCCTVYDSKDLEPTQLPINDRLDKENVAHIHHGIPCSQKKYHEYHFIHVLCRDMDETGKHHSQQMDIRTEKQTPYILTYKWVLSNENTHTEGNIIHRAWGLGVWRGIAGSGGIGEG